MGIFNTLTIRLIYMLFETFRNKFSSMLSIFFHFVNFLFCLFLLFCYCYSCIYYSFFYFLLLLFYLSRLFKIPIFNSAYILFNIHFICFPLLTPSHSTHFLLVLSLLISLYLHSSRLLFFCLDLLNKIRTSLCLSDSPLSLFFFFI